MKMLSILLLVACMNLHATGNSQSISLSFFNAPLQKVLEEIEKQGSVRFVYSKGLLETAKPISLNVSNQSLDKVLDVCFRNQPITYLQDGKFIVLKISKVEQKLPTNTPADLIDVTGQVLNAEGEPAAGVTVKVKGQVRQTVTDGQGRFHFEGLTANAVLVLSGAETITKEVAVNGRKELTIHIQRREGVLDETIVIAYGKTTRRLATGNIARIGAAVIQEQPVNNPILALQGRVPGLIINQTSGYAGGALQIQLRGQQSLLQGSNPFIVIDGVPAAAQNNPLNQLSNASSSNNAWGGGGLSPLYLLNPSDIESIEILKDADATAIYGSRGANGVILITTKQGKAGKPRIEANVSQSWSRITRQLDMMNTQQYTAMRREAFTNDGIAMTLSNAPDLLRWDTTRYTNFQDLLMGGTAINRNAQVSLSGGTELIQVMFSGSYQSESTVLPTTFQNRKINGQTGFRYQTADKRFMSRMTLSYASARNELPSLDAAALIDAPPHMKLYKDDGKLNWEEGGVAFRNIGLSSPANPLAHLYVRYTGRFDNLNTSGTFEYSPIKALTLRLQAGFNQTLGEEKRLHPSASLDPFDANILPRASFGQSRQFTWILEPQVEYRLQKNYGHFTALLGSTLQAQQGQTSTISASNYSSDLLLESTVGAGAFTINNGFSEYKYSALFGRILYNYQDKYLLSLTGRRDGSSRFGPANQFAFFGAVGGGWIFSREKIIQKHLPWLSFGKIRGSFGRTGNDQIGDYQFLDTWTGGSTSYLGATGLQPTALFNPELAWEINRKWEASVDLGFFKQRLELSSTFFVHRSGNQLISYNLPAQTGFPNIRRNLDALIENRGWEFIISGIPIQRAHFSWNIQLNFTRSRNELKSFPGVENSSYSQLYIVGQPLSLAQLYRYTGIGSNGLYTFEDVDGNGIIGRPDRIVLRHTQPDFFGGWSNQLRYKKVQLSFFFQFVKQDGRNYLSTLSTFVPGTIFRNQPLLALNRWTHPGDLSPIQRYTTLTSGSANQASYLTQSDAAYGNASFLRLKNVAISHPFYLGRKTAARRPEIQVYAQAQNLFTLTNYKGADPENQSIYRMPPLRTILFGSRITL